MSDQRVYKLEINTHVFQVLEKDLLEYGFYKYCEKQYGKVVSDAILEIFMNRGSLAQVSYMSFVGDQQPFHVVILKPSESKKLEKMIKVVTPDGGEYEMYHWHDIVSVYLMCQEFFNLSLDDFQQMVISMNRMRSKVVLKSGLTILG